MKVILLVAVVLFASQAFADAKADIAYREGVMMSVGGNMKAMVAILKGKVHQNDFKFHARSLADLAEIVPTIFPAGSGEGKTDALPAIWKKPDEFKKTVQRFVKAANNLADSSESGDMGKIGPAINELGKACKNCHDNFRKEHKSGS